MDLSVLLPLSDAPERAAACLESLERTLPRRLSHEVILVENLAAPLPRALRDSLSASPRHSFVRHDGPPERAASLNVAARAARAPVLCLLDPGLTLMPGWLAPMLQRLRADNAVGCVGNVQREAYSGLIEQAGLSFDARGLPTPLWRGEGLLPRAPYQRRAAVAATCCLVTRAVFNQLDGFDAGFRQRFDDVDFCLRATVAGYRHYVVNRSVVYHQAAPIHPPTPDPDELLYRQRWGDRARASYTQLEARRRDMAAFSPERWEAARESRRQRRQDVRDDRRDGRRYLQKHCLHPWRYNFERVCRALVQTSHPLPDAIPRLPSRWADAAAERSGLGAPGNHDTALFFPPAE